MRSRVRFALRGLFLGLLVAIPVSADQEPGAPPGQYQNFALQDRRIRDLKTGLIWERGISASPVDYTNAKNTCTPPKRLPTLKELLTLIDEQPHLDYDLDKLENVQKMIDPAAFGEETAIDKAYWTSSTSGGRAWDVDFGTGQTFLAPTTDTRYVRCVEGP